MSSRSSRSDSRAFPPLPGREAPDRLLAQLRGGAGDFVSGSLLGERLGVSRTAIWKQVRTLQDEGYLIESHPKRGYRLRSVPSEAHPREIAVGLETRWLGHQVVVYDAVDSTNRAAMEDAALTHGAVVVARRQTEGRGRLGRKWVVPPGTLPFSLVLEPRIAPTRAPLLTLAAAVGLVDGIREGCGLDTEIKWPNDVLWRGRKVAGILTEVRSDPDQVVRAVVGIGLNVNTREEDFDPLFRDRAVSVAAAAGREVDPNGLLRHLLAALEPACDQVCGDSPEGVGRLVDQYRARCTTVGRWVNVTGVRGDVFCGYVHGIDAEGALLVRREDGATERVLAGDVSLSRPPGQD